MDNMGYVGPSVHLYSSKLLHTKLMESKYFGSGGFMSHIPRVKIGRNLDHLNTFASDAIVLDYKYVNQDSQTTVFLENPVSISNSAISYKDDINKYGVMGYEEMMIASHDTPTWHILGDMHNIRSLDFIGSRAFINNIYSDWDGESNTPTYSNPRISIIPKPSMTGVIYSPIVHRIKISDWNSSGVISVDESDEIFSHDTIAAYVEDIGNYNYSVLLKPLGDISTHTIKVNAEIKTSDRVVVFSEQTTLPSGELTYHINPMDIEGVRLSEDSYVYMKMTISVDTNDDNTYALEYLPIAIKLSLPEYMYISSNKYIEPEFSYSEIVPITIPEIRFRLRSYEEPNIVIHKTRASDKLRETNTIGIGNYLSVEDGEYNLTIPEYILSDIIYDEPFYMEVTSSDRPGYSKVIDIPIPTGGQVTKSSDMSNKIVIPDIPEFKNTNRCLYVKGMSDANQTSQKLIEIYDSLNTLIYSTSSYTTGFNILERDIGGGRCFVRTTFTSKSGNVCIFGRYLEIDTSKTSIPELIIPESSFGSISMEIGLEDVAYPFLAEIIDTDTNDVIWSRNILSNTSSFVKNTQEGIGRISGIPFNYSSKFVSAKVSGSMSQESEEYRLYTYVYPPLIEVDTSSTISRVKITAQEDTATSASMVISVRDGHMGYQNSAIDINLLRGEHMYIDISENNLGGYSGNILISLKSNSSSFVFDVSGNGYIDYSMYPSKIITIEDDHQYQSKLFETEYGGISAKEIITTESIRIICNSIEEYKKIFVKFVSDRGIESLHESDYLDSSGQNPEIVMKGMPPVIPDPNGKIVSYIVVYDESMNEIARVNNDFTIGYSFEVSEGFLNPCEMYYGNNYYPKDLGMSVNTLPSYHNDTMCIRIEKQDSIIDAYCSGTIGEYDLFQYGDIYTNIILHSKKDGIIVGSAGASVLQGGDLPNELKAYVLTDTRLIYVDENGDTVESSINFPIGEFFHLILSVNPGLITISINGVEALRVPHASNYSGWGGSSNKLFIGGPNLAMDFGDQAIADSYASTYEYAKSMMADMSIYSFVSAKTLSEEELINPNQMSINKYLYGIDINTIDYSEFMLIDGPKIVGINDLTYGQYKYNDYYYRGIYMPSKYDNIKRSNSDIYMYIDRIYNMRPGNNSVGLVISESRLLNTYAIDRYPDIISFPDTIYFGYNYESGLLFLEVSNNIKNYVDISNMPDWYEETLSSGKTKYTKDSMYPVISDMSDFTILKFSFNNGVIYFNNRPIVDLSQSIKDGYIYGYKSSGGIDLAAVRIVENIL